MHIIRDSAAGRKAHRETILSFNTSVSRFNAIHPVRGRQSRVRRRCFFPVGDSSKSPRRGVAPSSILDSASALVSLGSHVDRVDNCEVAPLYTASRWGNFAVVRFLAPLGADVNMTTRGGWAPIHVATFHHPAVVIALASRVLRADPDGQIAAHARAHPPLVASLQYEGRAARRDSRQRGEYGRPT